MTSDRRLVKNVYTLIPLFKLTSERASLSLDPSCKARRPNLVSWDLGSSEQAEGII